MELELYDWPQLPGVTSTHPASPENKLNTISIPSFGDNGLRLWGARLDALVQRNHSPSAGKGYRCSRFPQSSTLCNPPFSPNSSHIPHSSYSLACLGFCNSTPSGERDQKGGAQAPPIWCLPYSLERDLPGTATSRIRSPEKPPRWPLDSWLAVLAKIQTSHRWKPHVPKVKLPRTGPKFARPGGGGAAD